MLLKICKATDLLSRLRICCQGYGFIVKATDLLSRLRIASYLIFVSNIYVIQLSNRASRGTRSETSVYYNVHMDPRGLKSLALSVQNHLRHPNSEHLHTLPKQTQRISKKI